VSLAVFDVDGVLAALPRGRRPGERSAAPPAHLSAPAAADDPPLAPGVAVLLRAHQAGHQVVYLSDRPERRRADTERWIERHLLPRGELLLRPDGDRSAPATLTLAALRRLSRRDQVALYVDDDPWLVDVVRGTRPAMVLGRVLHASW
jgi:hypothetical protein